MILAKMERMVAKMKNGMVNKIIFQIFLCEYVSRWNEYYINWNYDADGNE